MNQCLNSLSCFDVKSSFNLDCSYINEELEINSPKSFILDEFPLFQSDEDSNGFFFHESKFSSKNENLSDFLESKSNISENEKILESNINTQNIFKIISKDGKNNFANFEGKFLNKTIIFSQEISDIQNENYQNDSNITQSPNPEKEEQKTLDFNEKDKINYLQKKRERSKAKNKKNNLKKNNSKKNKKYICECGKIFSTRENKKLHYINVHLNKKPYRCDYCNFEFSHRNGKKYHERVFHTFIFPYNCKDCLMSFASNSALNYHIKTKHRKL